MLYSDRHGFADVWLPLWAEGKATGALLRVQLQAEWFGARRALSHSEELALLLLQRSLRRLKERRRRAEEQRGLHFGLFTTQTELSVTVMRAACLPDKAGYFALVQLLAGPGDGAAGAAASPATVLASFTTAVVPEECGGAPAWGEDFSVALPSAPLPAGAVVRVAVHRMPKRFGGTVGPAKEAEVGPGTLVAEGSRRARERGSGGAEWRSVAMRSNVLQNALRGCAAPRATLRLCLRSDTRSALTCSRLLPPPPLSIYSFLDPPLPPQKQNKFKKGPSRSSARGAGRRGPRGCAWPGRGWTTCGGARTQRRAHGHRIRTRCARAAAHACLCVR